VIQPHLPVRLPCYDFTLLIEHTLGTPLLAVMVITLGVLNSDGGDGRCVQGPGTYSPQHADLRLLAIPTSWSRVGRLQSELRTVFWDWLHLLRYCDPLCSPL